MDCQEHRRDIWGGMIGSDADRRQTATKLNTNLGERDREHLPTNMSAGADLFFVLNNLILYSGNRLG